MSDQELRQFIDKRKSDRKLSAYNEDCVKQGIILPILHLLGWNTSDIDEVTPEYNVGKGKVDYSLRIEGKSKFFIEAKNAGEDLKRHEEQFLKYSFRQGIELAVLTNGIAWCFYMPMERVDWQERNFCTVDIKKQETSHIIQNLTAILSKDKVHNGEALKYAEAIYKEKQEKSQVGKTMPEAWNKLISEPDALLIDLLVETTERLCGFKPGNRMVAEFLGSHREKFLLTGAESAGVQREKRTVGRRGGLRVSRERIGRRDLGRKGYTQIQDYVVPVIRMMRQGLSHTEAVRRQADVLDIAYQTVQNQCTRVLGINTQEFAARVSDGTIVRLLTKRYPHESEVITKEIGGR